ARKCAKISEEAEQKPFTRKRNSSVCCTGSNMHYHQQSDARTCIGSVDELSSVLSRHQLDYDMPNPYLFQKKNNRTDGNSIVSYTSVPYQQLYMSFVSVRGADHDVVYRVKDFR